MCMYRRFSLQLCCMLQRQDVCIPYSLLLTAAFAHISSRCYPQAGLTCMYRRFTLLLTGVAALTAAIVQSWLQSAMGSVYTYEPPLYNTRLHKGRILFLFSVLSLALHNISSTWHVQAVEGREQHEQLGRRTHRLWHGTSNPAAWEKGIGPAEWHPFSRRYAIRMPGASPTSQQSKKKSLPSAHGHGTAPGQQAQQSMAQHAAAQHSMVPSLLGLQPPPNTSSIAVPMRGGLGPMPIAAAGTPRSIYVGNLGAYAGELFAHLLLANA